VTTVAVHHAAGDVAADRGEDSGGRDRLVFGPGVNVDGDGGLLKCSGNSFKPSL
jgi:hypothetical protein